MRKMMMQLLNSLCLLLLLVQNKVVVVNGALSRFPRLPWSKFIRPPISLEDEIGTSPALNYQYFDPLHLANEDNFAFYRECELKHGRIAMMATIGMLVESDATILHRSLPHIINFDDTASSSSSGIKSIPLVTKPIWISMILFIGVLESQIFIQRDEKDMPGDYGTGYFGLRDKSRHERYVSIKLYHFFFLIAVSIICLRWNIVGIISCLILPI